MEVKMNKRKLAILSLILPILVSGSVQANPWKNTLKRTGYAGAAVLAVYTGYRAAQAYGLFGQPEQAPIVPAQNQPGIKTAQQLLEENQAKLIDARVAQRAALKAAQEEEAAKKALAARLKDEEKTKAALETQMGSLQGILEQRSQEAQQLKQAVLNKDSEIEQLATLNTDLLGQLSKIQVSTQPTLPVTIVSSPAASALPGAEVTEPIFDLKNEYIKVLRTNALNMGNMINAARKAFDAIVPFLKQHYTDDQVLINFGTTYGQIRTCQDVMTEFNESLKSKNYDLSEPADIRQAEEALKLLYAACKSINATLPMYRIKIADKASTNWSEWVKGKEAQILEEFDSFKLSFEQRLKQLHPIKDNSLTQ